MYWISYGGGVNSTALAVLCYSGHLPAYRDARIVFADTLTERPETYRYIEGVFRPWLRSMDRELEVVTPEEGVYARWQRLRVTGSRLLRTCTSHAKIRPLEQHLLGLDPSPVHLIGIDAGEPHRAKPGHPQDKIPKLYPLVELGIDRDGCADIIKQAGLCLPSKSGCWCCPFMRVKEVLTLARAHPDRMEEIATLERAAFARHGKDFFQFHDRPASYWIGRARQEDKQLTLDLNTEDESTPCSCYDG